METQVLKLFLANATGAWRRGAGAVFNALTGNALARVETSVQETRAIAEENRRLLRSLHDSLRDETLSAHLLARLSEREADRDVSQ
jgi:hypothetical protein